MRTALLLACVLIGAPFLTGVIVALVATQRKPPKDGMTEAKALLIIAGLAPEDRSLFLARLAKAWGVRASPQSPQPPKIDLAGISRSWKGRAS